MFRDRCRQNSGHLGLILKSAIGFGIVIFTIPMVLWFCETLARYGAPWQIQLAVSGIFVAFVAILSVKIFERVG